MTRKRPTMPELPEGFPDPTGVDPEVVAAAVRLWQRVEAGDTSPRLRAALRWFGRPDDEPAAKPADGGDEPG